MENKTTELMSKWAEETKTLESLHQEFISSVERIQDVECARAVLALANFIERCLIRDSELVTAALDTLANRQMQMAEDLNRRNEWNELEKESEDS